MDEDFQEVAQPEQGTQRPVETIAKKTKKQTTPGWLEMLAQLGLGETVARIGTGVLTLVLVFAVVAVMRQLVTNLPLTSFTNKSANQAAVAT